MKELIEAITKLLEAIERMAGGRKKAQMVFWIVFSLLVLLAVKPAIENVNWLFSSANVSANIITGIVFLLAAISGFVIFFGITTIAAAIPAQFIRSLFDANYRIRLQRRIKALMVILERADTEGIDKQLIHDLKMDTEQLYTEYTNEKTNKVFNWAFPEYFKKDVRKWRLVRVSNKKEEVET